MIEWFKGTGSTRITTVVLFIALAVAPLYACANVDQQGASWPAATPLPQATGSPSVITPATFPSFRFRNQGVYESCSPWRGSMCLDRLQQIAQAGFKLVVNYGQLYGTAEEELAYAQRAAELGIKIIWNLDSPALRDQGDILHTFPQLSATCDCSDAAVFVRYTINLVKNLPATWGYYIGDEVPMNELARLNAFTDYVKGLDPSHPRLIVQESGSAYEAEANLAPFADTSDVLAVDFYPVGARDESINETGAIAQTVQSLATQNGKQSAMVLQAFSWSEYNGQSCSPFPACTTYPTVDEMRQMLNFTLKNSHPAFILWYSYYDVMGSEHWNELIEAAKG